MMNQVMLIGRIVTIESVENENIKKAIVTIAVNRNFKNQDGTYDTDFINCILFPNIAEKITEYCKKGDLIGIHGRLRQGVETKNLELVAEKITFLSTKKENDNESEEN